MSIEPQFLKMITNGPYVPKTVADLDKLELQWSNDVRRIVNLDQRFKSLIISCLPDDLMEQVINCPTAKEA